MLMMRARAHPPACHIIVLDSCFAHRGAHWRCRWPAPGFQFFLLKLPTHMRQVFRVVEEFGSPKGALASSRAHVHVLVNAGTAAAGPAPVLQPQTSAPTTPCRPSRRDTRPRQPSDLPPTADGIKQAAPQQPSKCGVKSAGAGHQQAAPQQPTCHARRAQLARCLNAVSTAPGTPATWRQHWFATWVPRCT